MHLPVGDEHNNQDLKRSVVLSHQFSQKHGIRVKVERGLRFKSLYWHLVFRPHLVSCSLFGCLNLLMFGSLFLHVQDGVACEGGC